MRVRTRSKGDVPSPRLSARPRLLFSMLLSRLMASKQESLRDSDQQKRRGKKSDQHVRSAKVFS